MVSGKVLAKVMESKESQYKFTKLIMNFECVVFSRTNPNQKVQIVRMLKEEGKKTLAIGDGVNDVNMIQEASIGIGVMGEEGKQAVNASDYAVPSFRFLQPLLLKFGRLSYFRNSHFVLFFFYKNFLFTIPQFYFAFYCDFSKKNLYNDFYMAFYNMIFTAFNISSRAIVDIDIDTEADYYQPGYLLESYLYFYGIKNIFFRFKRYMFWFILGMMESFLLFHLLYFSLREKIYYDGHETSWEVISIILFSTIIFFQ